MICVQRKKLLILTMIPPVNGVPKSKSSRFKNSKFKVGEPRTLNLEH